MTSGFEADDIEFQAMQRFSVAECRIMSCSSSGICRSVWDVLTPQHLSLIKQVSVEQGTRIETSRVPLILQPVY
jgi:hypothetical protein